MKYVLHMLCLCLIVACGAALPAMAQGGGWSVPVSLSPAGQDTTGYTPTHWFPDLAAGPEDSLHVIWSGGIAPDNAAGTGELSGSPSDLLLYRGLHQGSWSPVTDIFAPRRTGDVERGSIVMGRDGKLHVLVHTYGTIYYLNAAWDRAGIVRAWSHPHAISTGEAYDLALAADSQGTLHALWTQVIPQEDTPTANECFRCVDLFYRRSQDGGRFWSWPVNLSRLPPGSSKPQISIDPFDRIHVVWDEGRTAGMYRRSDDGGMSWGDPTVFHRTDEPIEYTDLAVSSAGLPLVVYSGRQTNRLYFQIAYDGDITWSDAAIIPGVQSFANRFDAYSLAPDSAGRIHLLLVGSQSEAESNAHQLLHLTWDSNGWSSPDVVMDDVELFPERPRLVVANGNELHAVWFTRSDAERPATGTEQPWYQVWYSRRQLDAPASPMPPLFTPTLPAPPAATATAPATPSATPVPTLEPQAARAALPDRPRPAWEQDGLRTLSLALLPLIGLLLIIGGLKWHNRRRR